MFAASATLVVTAVAVTTTTPLAYARIAHHYESVITGVPATGPGGVVPVPGGFGELNSMTVHSGDLYVAEHLQGEPLDEEFSRTDQWRPSASKPGEYEFVSQLPKQEPEPFQNRAGGVALGTAGGETELFIGQGGFHGGFETPPRVNVFADACGNLECATFQKLWEGAEVPEPTRPFGAVDGVVVDHSTGAGSSAGDWAVGDVFVADGAHSVVDVFEPKAGGEEHYVEQVTGVSGPIAVSGFNGDLVAGSQVFRPEKEALKKGKYASACQLTPGGQLEGISAVAVDDGNGEIFVAAGAPQGGPVFEFGPECRFLGTITSVPKEGTVGGVKGEIEEVPLGGINSLAVDPASQRLFVGAGVVDVFGPDVVLPDVVTEEPSSLGLDTDPTTGATSWGIEANGSVNPLGEGPATCSFAWGPTEAFGHEAPCGASLEGMSPIGVHASLTDLEPDTSYFYRLQAHNKNGTNQGEASQDHRFTTPGPGLRSESASNVSSSSVTLEGKVAPHDTPAEPPEEHDLQVATKAPTFYFFQYSTQSTSVCAAEPAACTSLPSAPVSVGSGPTDVEVSQHPQGLTPNTTYHYRLVAENEALPASEPGKLVPFYGPDRTFTTQGPSEALTLPDGRAWELVSPADKHGASVALAGGRVWGRAAATGGQFTFVASIPTEDNPPGNPFTGVQVLSMRSASGRWSSTDIPLYRTQQEGALVCVEGCKEYHFFSEDFSLAVAEPEGSGFPIPEGWHQNERGEWEHVVETSPVPTAHTPYLRHDATCSSAPATCYEPLIDSEDVTSGLKYEGGAGFAGATADGRHLFIGSNVQLTTTPISGAALYEWSAARPPAQRLELVNVTPGGEPLPSEISYVTPDASRIVLGGSYVREAATGEALRLGGSFAGASADATKLFYTTGAGLYLCELATTPLRCTVTDLTPTPAPGQPGFGEEITISSTLGVSADGSRVYFLAHGALAPGAKPGAENLYVAHDQEGKWTTSFIAAPQDLGLDRRVSPDGRWLAFSTKTPVTGYDNRDAKTHQPDSEVYLYDAKSGRLSCPSCDRSDGRPTGESVVPTTQYLRAASFEAPSRALFDTGRLFFDSADALVPQDTNGNTDAYEYEPPGVGSCTSVSATFNAASGGCVALISSGAAPGGSVFLDASSTGSDAFFTTSERLVPEDVDNALDVYDAHECTSSSPCPPPQATPPPECGTAAACLLAPAPQPEIFGSGPTESLVGKGNAAPVPMPVVTTSKTAAQLRAERLAKALKACRRRYPHSQKRLTACERKTNARYAVKSYKSSARRLAVTSHHGMRG